MTAVDPAGNASAPTPFSWTVDASVSSVVVTVRRPAADALQTGTSIRATWTGSSNIVRYEVYEQVGLGATPALVQSSAARSFRRTGVPGATHCNQVYGYDAVGTVGIGVAVRRDPVR